MKLKTKVFYFWGGMDALAILIYCVHVLWQGGIPLISDILSFSRISDTGTVTGNGIYNTIVTLLFALDVILFVSLFICCLAFFYTKPLCSPVCIYSRSASFYFTSMFDFGLSINGGIVRTCKYVF